MGVWIKMINHTDVKKAIYEYEDKTIQNLNEVLSYDFPPETDTVLFEVHSGGYGVFGISITPMTKGEEMGYDSIETLLRKTHFEIDLEQFLDLDNDKPYDEKYMDKLGNLKKIVFNLIIPFFSECFHKARYIPPHIQFYIRTHESDDVFNLQNKTWVEIEDLYE
ncbi:hypothetical protein [Thermoactinomyces mirandus]|uniref:Uncharacterized protein n=1 Tax=Thermoactinomyces mirandus TaxID=2756294 RepID=A0A7W1XR19_9BACL|nr:hypothetical protein [Thermoactinomyces mirandus]MBA4601722.1 hypothetical protein [Thermoactinomyces mirandus]